MNIGKIVSISLIIAILLLFPGSRLIAGFIEDGVQLSTAPGFHRAMSIVSCPNGGAIAVWKEEPHVEGFFLAQKIDLLGRIQWPSGGVRVSNISCLDAYAAAVSDGAGGVFVAYLCDNSNIYAQHIDASGTPLWTADGISVCSVTEDKNYVSLCRDSAGGIIVCWKDRRNGGEGVYAQRVTAAGLPAWDPGGVAVDSENLSYESPEICSDGQGGAIIAWNNHDVWAQRIRVDGTVAWGPGSVLIRDTDYNQEHVRIACDNRYGAVIYWEARLYNTSPFAVCVGAVDSTGTLRYSVMELNWTGYPGGLSPSVAVDEEGGFIISYLEDEFGPPFPYCIAKRLNAFGQQVWRTVICAEGDSHLLHAATDGAKGAHFIWSDNRAGAFKIYTQHIDSLGSRTYPNVGIPLAAGSSAQGEGFICHDGSGGAIMAWTDYRDGYEDSDIYAGSIDNMGQVIATLLQSFTASFTGDAVTLSWTLSEANRGMVFDVYRRKGTSGPFYPLPEPRIVQEGLTFSFTDRTVGLGSVYSYRVVISEDAGRRTLFETGPVRTPAQPLALYQNRPNPFNPVTDISYFLPGACRVRLEIFDVSGRTITVLVDADQVGGPHSVRWGGENAGGTQVGSGMYLYRLTAGKNTIMRKMVLIR